MIKALLNTFLIIFFYLLWACNGRNKMISYEVSYVYHQEKTLFKSRTLATDDSLIIYIELINPILFSTTSIEEFKNNYKLNYYISTTDPNPLVVASDSIGYNKIKLAKFENDFYLTLSIAKIPSIKQAVFTLDRIDLARNRTESNDLLIDFQMIENQKNFLLYDQSTNHPILENFVATKDSIKVMHGHKSTDQDVIMYYTNQQLPPAIPPHREADSSSFAFPKMDSSFQIRAENYFTLPNEGLYVLKEDSSQMVGVPILVKGNKYPKLTKPGEMIEPLIYITTRTDFKKIKSSSDPKATLDSFWINIGGTKDYSRALIKSYYEKVEYSNKVFTNFKEGWKTDRGMIYIVFGKPDQVYKNGDTEEWYYENIMTHMVSFTFINKKINFTSDNYILVRNPLYEKFWYSAIEKWRNGIITK
jgi:GWxTD domain-containing protein